MAAKARPRGRKLQVLAPAKVNLFLHLIARRDDGYHLLESLFAFADFGDRLSVEEAGAFSFSVKGPFAEACKKEGCAGDDNLVMQAAYRLAKILGDEKKAAKLILEKNLPLAAGFGGGSSDAAATLKALLILWNAEPDEEKLFDTALALGADVPACLAAEACFVSGIGEDITPVSTFDDLPCLLVNPMKSVSTGAVFKAFAESGQPFSKPLALIEDINVDLKTLLENTHNDLENTAITLCPDIKQVLGEIEKQTGCWMARMSGSGASCFGLFKDQEMAENAARAIQKARPGWWVKSCVLTSEPRFLLEA